MTLQWTQLKVFGQTNFSVTAPWLVALEDFDVATILKIEASGTWTSGVLPACEPDGLTGFVLPAAQLVLESCRYGALLGKFGGSSAVHQVQADLTKPLEASQPFPIGSYCVIKVPAEVFGPLYVGFNMLSRPINIATLTVTISGARP